MERFQSQSNDFSGNLFYGFYRLKKLSIEFISLKLCATLLLAFSMHHYQLPYHITVGCSNFDIINSRRQCGGGVFDVSIFTCFNSFVENDSEQYSKIVVNLNSQLAVNIWRNRNLDLVGNWVWMNRNTHAAVEIVDASIVVYNYVVFLCFCLTTLIC